MIGTTNTARCGLCERGALTWLALLMLLHGTYSVAPDLTRGARHAVFLTGSIGLAALFGVYVWVGRWLLVGVCPRDRVATPDMVDAILPIVTIVSALYFSLPDGVAILLTLGCVLPQAFLLARRALRASLIFSCGFLLVGLFAVIVKTKLRHLGADMLPVSVWADRSFLHGMNPYFGDHTAVTPWPFFYLPLQWLIYLPLVVLHLDVRWINFVSIVGTIWLLTRLWRDLMRPWTAFALLLALVAARPSTEMLYQGEVWPLWFLISAFIVAFLRGRVWLAGVLVGLLLAYSQTALVIAALIAVHQLRSGGPWRVTLTAGAVALLVYLAFIFPFAHGMVAFIDTNYIVLPHLAGIISERVRHNATTQVSLTNLLTRLSASRWRASLQLMAGLGGMLVLALRPTSPRGFLIVCGITYLVAIGLNMQVWKYYYVPGLVFLFWSTVTTETTGTALRPSPT